MIVIDGINLIPYIIGFGVGIAIWTLSCVLKILCKVV